MAAGTTPVFVDTIQIGMVQMTAANTNRDGTGTLYTICSGATDGTRVDELVFQFQVTTTAQMIRVYIHDGTNTYLFAEIPVSANTASGTVPALRYYLKNADGSPLAFLKNSWSIKASINAAEACNAFANRMGDY